MADLFRKAAAVELGEHFAQEAALSGLVGGNEANLTNAIPGEGYESTTMYPTFARQAKAAGDTAAADLFTEIAKDEATHQAAYKAALAALRTGMYPTFARQAKAAGDTAAATLFQHNATDEADHAQSFPTARKGLG
ncbi:ferritin family protein [Kitasatospora sp. NPDC059648]|uniref:ferritin family protein n=1 Tax=Kitasatospora sp. NPDC059648 TaxID=3346894 RepID=UPI0036C6A007